jgi:hypothetical protein
MEYSELLSFKAFKALIQTTPDSAAVYLTSVFTRIISINFNSMGNFSQIALNVRLTCFNKTKFP